LVVGSQCKKLGRFADTLPASLLVIVFVLVRQLTNVNEDAQADAPSPLNGALPYRVRANSQMLAH
jgi:hypothetical protein